ncbi:hypothetical protein BT63DRAFT_359876, partial [Microthyrium microscopicum]
MRLINTSSFKLRSFDGNDVPPPYAILSHTWGPDEISFEQRDRLLRSKDPGFVISSKGAMKIALFCETAKAAGFQWAWADTCSIDKSSSAELSEAINSMYEWYEQAVVCYVYLEDFSGSRNTLSIEGSRCRWFGRGWTLQELVASANVVFYNSNWQDIGTKRSLAPILSDITGIDRSLLLGDKALTDYSVAQTMRWASGWQTTRIEDRAYSLLGMFGINMPLLYGEDARAFLRLQEEILRHNTDMSILAW